MATLHVIAVGGTGERVMRSFVMLLAGGLDLKGIDSVQPIFLDTDKESRALTKARKLIEDYKFIREKLYDKQFMDTNCMFHMEIKDPFEIAIDGTAIDTIDTLVNPKANNFPQNMKEEFNVLYSQKSKSMKLSWGFVGNPSIGSIVLQKSIKQFPNFGQNDRIFILNSIFGGTGAAGFPLIVKYVRKYYPKVPVGAVTMFPYFGFNTASQDNNNKNKEVEAVLKDYDVNENDFAIKTKAALLYYDKYIKCRSMYYLGPGSHDNYSMFNKCKGGNEQDNPANMLEILGAKAVAHFSEHFEDGGNNVCKYYECKLGDERESQNYYNLRELDPDTNFRKVFVRLSLLWYIWEKAVPVWISEGNDWVKHTQMLTDENLRSFLSQHLGNFLQSFKEWATELSEPENGNTHALKFKFFNFDVGGDCQNTIGQKFFPVISHEKSGIFGGKSTVSANIMEAALDVINKLQDTGKYSEKTLSDKNKYCFSHMLSAIEHLVSDEKNPKFDI